MRLPFPRRSRAATGRQQSDAKSGGSVRFLLILALIAWAFRSLMFAPFSIPSGSMLPTLLIGDYVLVAKWPFGYSRNSFLFGIPPIEGRIFVSLPERGDIVVIRHPTQNIDLIKRVVGLPGDTIALESGMLILNGKALPRDTQGIYSMPISANSPCRVVPPAQPVAVRLGEGREYCAFPAYRETLPGGPSYRVIDQVENPRADDLAPTRVPDGHLFLMGDNRDDSLDSRYSAAEGGIGFVPVENLIGRAVGTFWSTDGSAEYIKPWTWFTALRPERLGNSVSGDRQ